MNETNNTNAKEMTMNAKLIELRKGSYSGQKQNIAIVEHDGITKKFTAPKLSALRRRLKKIGVTI